MSQIIKYYENQTFDNEVKFGNQFLSLENETNIPFNDSYEPFYFLFDYGQCILPSVDFLNNESSQLKAYSDDPEPYFYIEKENKNMNGKKRGRGHENDLIEKHHDRFSDDYLAIKIQIKFFTYIIDFFNDILKNLNYKERFLQLSSKIKKNITKNFTKSLKIKTIGEIISNDINGKYRKYDKDINIKICEKLKKIEIFRKLLSLNYLQFFKKFYFRSQKVINLKEYGLDKNIILSQKTKPFQDLLNSFEGSVENRKYQRTLNEFAIKKYMIHPFHIFC